MKQDRVIWFALVFATFIYAAIAYTLAPNPEGSFSEAVQRHPFTPILYAVAALTFVMATILPGRLRVPDRTKLIVGMALYEACAIYGLMAAMIARDWRLLLPAWILGLIGMWRLFPSSEPALTV